MSTTSITSSTNYQRSVTNENKVINSNYTTKGTIPSNNGLLPLSSSSTTVPTVVSNTNNHGYWQDDEDIDECNDCHDEFNFFNRRHHCRICGLIYCDNCAPINYDLPQTRYKGQRCCKQCYNSIMNPTPRRKGRIPPNETTNIDGEIEHTQSKFSKQNNNIQKDLITSLNEAQPLSPLQYVADEQTKRMMNKSNRRTTSVPSSDQGNSDEDEQEYSDSEDTDTDEEDTIDSDDDDNDNTTISTNESNIQSKNYKKKSIKFIKNGRLHTSSRSRPPFPSINNRQQQQIQQNMEDMVTTILQRIRKQTIALQLVQNDAELSKKENTLLKKIMKKQQQRNQRLFTSSSDFISEQDNIATEKPLPKPKPGNQTRVIPISKEGIVDTATTKEGYFGNMYTGFQRGRGNHNCSPEVEVTFTDGPTGLQLAPALPFMRLLGKALGIKDVALPSNSYIEIYGNAMENNNNNSVVMGNSNAGTTNATGKDQSGEKVLRSRYGVNVNPNDKVRNVPMVANSSQSTTKGPVNYLDVQSLMSAVSSAVKIDYESLQFYTASDPNSALSAPAHPLPDLLIQAPYSLTIARIISLPNGDPSPAQCLNNACHHPCCEWLRPGLLLTHINGVHIAGIGPTRSLDMFNRAIRPVTLRFLYHPLAILQFQHATVLGRSQILRAQVDSLTNTVGSAINVWTKAHANHQQQLRTISNAFLSQREQIKTLQQQIKENNTIIDQTKEEVKELRTRVDLLATLRGGDTAKTEKGWNKLAALVGTKNLANLAKQNGEGSNKPSDKSVTNTINENSNSSKTTDILAPPSIVRTENKQIIPPVTRTKTVTGTVADPLYPSQIENEVIDDGEDNSPADMLKSPTKMNEFVFQGSEQQLLQQLLDASKTSKSISSIINTMVQKRSMRLGKGNKVSSLQRRIGEVTTDIHNLTMVSALLQRDAAMTAADALHIREKELESENNDLRTELATANNHLTTERERVKVLESFITSVGYEIPSSGSNNTSPVRNSAVNAGTDFSSLWSAFRSTTQQLTLMSAAYEKANKDAEETRILNVSLQRQCAILRSKLADDDYDDSVDHSRENTNPFQFDTVVTASKLKADQSRSKSIFPSLISDTISSIATSITKPVEDYILQTSDANSIPFFKNTVSPAQLNPLLPMDDLPVNDSDSPSGGSSLFIAAPDDLGDMTSNNLFIPPPNDTLPVPSIVSSGNPFNTDSNYSKEKPEFHQSNNLDTSPLEKSLLPVSELPKEILNDMDLPFTLTSADLSNARLALNPKAVPAHLIAGELYQRHATTGSTARSQGRGDGSILCSYFYKCSKENAKKNFGNWAWRFGTVGCGQCIYYKSEFDSKSQGDFSLRTVSFVTSPKSMKKLPPSTTTNPNPGNFVLEITLSYGKVYLFAFQTADEYEIWYRLFAAITFQNRQDTSSFGNQNTTENDTVKYDHDDDNEEENNTSLSNTTNTSKNPFLARSSSFMKKLSSRRDSLNSVSSTNSTQSINIGNRSTLNRTKSTSMKYLNIPENQDNQEDYDDEENNNE